MTFPLKPVNSKTGSSLVKKKKTENSPTLFNIILYTPPIPPRPWTCWLKRGRNGRVTGHYNFSGSTTTMDTVVSSSSSIVRQALSASSLADNWCCWWSGNSSKCCCNSAAAGGWDDWCRRSVSLLSSCRGVSEPGRHVTTESTDVTVVITEPRWLIPLWPMSPPPPPPPPPPPLRRRSLCRGSSQNILRRWPPPMPPPPPPPHGTGPEPLYSSARRLHTPNRLSNTNRSRRYCWVSSAYRYGLAHELSG